jgi:hypothetical protein
LDRVGELDLGNATNNHKTQPDGRSNNRYSYNGDDEDTKVQWVNAQGLSDREEDWKEDGSLCQRGLYHR